ncbi:glycoside hydrolase family 18 protein [Actinomadura meridiana]|uniref:chitinase n=1 Tax=Actinomadura meridiana TaxID=559626 RepID=A0ABP8C3S3_9ACTN
MKRIWAPAVLTAGLLVGLPSPAHADNVLANAGFESGSLSGWTCAGGSVVSTPVRTGSYALAGGVSTGSTGQCTQTVNVQPNTAYSLSAWVRGSYVYMGVTGGTQTWTPSASDYTKLSLSFTTGADQKTVEIFLHGWYGNSAYYADDVLLDGPGGEPQPGVPGAPDGPKVGTVTDDSIALSWEPASGTVTGYRVYEGSALRATVTGTSATLTGLDACTTHRYTVAAYNDVGESAKSAQVSGRTSGCTDIGLPKHALIGYLHASFANGSGYVRMADVPDAWDIIDLAFGEPTSPTSGDVRFDRCPVSECKNVESDEEFIAAIRDKQAQGKKVLISIGGQDGQVQLTTTAARDTFVRSVSAIIDKYGLDGLDVDFEGHSLYLNSGDTDFRNPTTPVIVNLISALKTLKAKYGSKFVLTMAPETFFVQVGHQFYGGAGGGDGRTGAYLPVIDAMRDDLTVLHVQDYNSGPVMGLDGQYHNMGGAEFHIAMTDMVRAGFTVANTGHTFPGLRPDQIAIGLPAAVSAGNGYTPPAQVQQAVNCLVKGTGCGSYTLRGGTSPGFRGLMTWSINWDNYYKWEFMDSHEPFLNGLP